MSKRRKKGKAVDDSEACDLLLIQFRKDMLSLMKAKDVKYHIYGKSKRQKKESEEWDTLDEKEKIEVILRKTKNKNLTIADFPKPPLYMVLKKVKFQTLKKVYKKYIDSGNANKDTVLSELFNKFYGGESSNQKRIIERENIKGIGNIFEEEYQFIQLCGQTISNDLIKIIFCYLPRNQEILFQVGRTCKHFYLILLTSWNSLKIRKQTIVKQISLLVLKNLRKIVIQTKESGVEKVSQTTLQYIWKNLNSEKLRELIIIGADEHFVMEGIFRLQKSKKYNNKSNNNNCFPLRNINKLELRGNVCSRGYIGTRVNDELFPSLVDIHVRSLNQFIIKGCSKIISLSVDFEHLNIDPNYFFSSSSSSCIRKLTIRNIKKMINYHNLSPDKFSKIFNFFSDLEELELEFDLRGWQHLNATTIFFQIHLYLLKKIL